MVIVEVSEPPSRVAPATVLVEDWTTQSRVRFVIANEPSSACVGGLCGGCAPEAFRGANAPPVTYTDTLRDWQYLIEAVELAGVQVIRLKVNRNNPDGLYVQDIFYVLWDEEMGQWVVIVVYPGDVNRREETQEMIEAVRESLPGCRVVKWDGEGTLECGDILPPIRNGSETLVIVGQRHEQEVWTGGPTIRTTPEGVKTFGSMLPNRHRVVVIPFYGTLHVTTTLSYAGKNKWGEHCFVANPNHIRADAVAILEGLGLRVIFIKPVGDHKNLWGCNVVPINGKLIMWNYPTNVEQLRDAGFDDIITIPPSDQLPQKDGSLTCCLGIGAFAA